MCQSQAGSGGWAGDASWPGITADLKPPSAVTWNSPTDLGQMIATTSKKVRVLVSQVIYFSVARAFVTGITEGEDVR